MEWAGRQGGGERLFELQFEVTFFFACPSSVALHLAAKPRELIDSPALIAAGLKFTNIKHFDSPAQPAFPSTVSHGRWQVDLNLPSTGR